ncbi:MAG: class I SAM-dependent methyltransferase [Verrucomicrobia bacterium]|nr:class I SAM-dependent methyltransferase [Verrucomicrobiota bacterium]
MEPLVLFEDAHLLAVNKPAGINTHSPGEFAIEGLHEWLQRRRTEKLAIIHRLDKDTSGVMVFGKSALANRSLTEQFATKTVRKTYLFLTAAAPPNKRMRIATPIDGKPTATWFEPAGRRGRLALMRAEPETGRTHQIRIHAAEAGFAVAGDELYEQPRSPLPRMMLHAAAIELRHPQSAEPVRFEAPEPASFTSPDWLVAAREMRELMFGPAETNAFRLVSGKADGFPDAIVDRYADRLLVQWYGPPDANLRESLRSAPVVERAMEKQPSGETASPENRFEIVENGLRFLVSLDAGYSTGIFLDQRENRRRVLAMDLRGKTVLNAFAYTCAFSVAAARAGATVTSLDLSKRYLEWGRDNFRLNGFDPAAHDFIYGDCFDWLARLAKKGRRFDLALLDPPTFSTAKKGGAFRAEKDYAKLVALAEPLVAPGGTLFCSTNARSVTPEQFLAAVRRGAQRVRTPGFTTQPPDFRVAAGEKPYLKCAWATLD